MVQVEGHALEARALDRLEHAVAVVGVDSRAGLTGQVAGRRIEVEHLDGRAREADHLTRRGVQHEGTDPRDLLRLAREVVALETRIRPGRVLAHDARRRSTV